MDNFLEEYNNDYWQPILAANNLNTFDTIWNLQTEWFEEPNIRRGGWSGVIKINLDTPQGKIGIFIKRQENHVSKTFRHPIKGIATFQKEFHNIQQLISRQVPTLNLVYFGQRNQQAILITQSLEGYESLDSKKLSQLDHLQKQALLAQTAQAVAKLHQYNFQHNCFYPKHIFVKKTNGQWDVRFIDLEKLKHTLLKKQAIIRDLLTLFRHADQHWTLKDRIYFFKAYVRETKLSNKSKKLWRIIAKKIQAKRK